jgi:hypothetical protein
MGAKWYEIDITYYIIKLFNKIGIVKLPGEKAKREHEKDLDLDESLINNIETGSITLNGTGNVIESKIENSNLAEV